ncbi:MAG: 4-hydroxy-tetrahydrodipicolinate reductase [Clostridiales Family XIII bacterium]|nr:4-hydroxy-tetrahydrodipicolinate reductase [Clostridiales Family XIII bacterium]
MNVIVCGAAGRMGREVICLIEKSAGLSLAAAVDPAGGEGIYQTLRDYTGPADVMVDFSHHSAIREITAYCETRNLPLVVAATGHTQEETELIQLAATRIPVFMSANMSVGVALLAMLVKQAAAVFHDCDVEIVETHHNRKADAPSGTALLLADIVKSERPDALYVCGREGNHKRKSNEIGIHSLRMGNVAGEHEVIFSTDSQTISLKHQAHDRVLFAEGAVAAAKFIVGKPNGLYRMEDMLEE